MSARRRIRSCRATDPDDRFWANAEAAQGSLFLLTTKDAAALCLGRAITANEPVISVDTKHRELVGEFKNGGQEWARSGQPVEVNTHDIPSHAEGKAIPYGVYDLARNEGWVSVGISRDTATFAANSILSWWEQLGTAAYPHATTLTITADSGGSNSARNRL